MFFIFLQFVTIAEGSLKRYKKKQPKNEFMKSRIDGDKNRYNAKKQGFLLIYLFLSSSSPTSGIYERD